MGEVEEVGSRNDGSRGRGVEVWVTRDRNPVEVTLQGYGKCESDTSLPAGSGSGRGRWRNEFWEVDVCELFY